MFTTLVFIFNLLCLVLADHVVLNPLSLKSYVPPKISNITATPSFLVNHYQSVNVSCSVKGIPPPGHGEIILKKQGLIVRSDSTIMADLQTTTSVFSIVVHKSYPGPYVCQATTKAGTCSKPFNFTIAVLPKPIDPPFGIKFLSNELLIGLNSRRFLGQGPIKMTEVLYKKQNDTTFLSYASDVTFPNDSIAIKDLEPFTFYNFRVVLYRGQIRTGMGPPGPIATIRTYCGVPTAGPEILLTYARNDTILYVEWKNPSPEQVRGYIIGYDIYYQQLGLKKSTKWTKIEIAHRDVSSATLKSLYPQVVYRVKIQLHNCAGKSPFSKEVRVTMGRLERPNGPNITLLNRTSNSLEFKWTIPSNAQPYTITKYMVNFAEEHNSTPNAIRFNAPTSDTRKVFEGLVPYTSYLFTVVAYNHEGAGKESQLSTRTLESAPSKVENLRVSKIGLTGINLIWKTPEFPNGIIRKYEVQISNSLKVWMFIPGKKFVNTTLFQANTLEEYTVYRFRVRGITILNGVWSDVIIARTMSSKPLEPPQTVETDVISPQSVLVKWEPPPPTRSVGRVTSYKIIYTDDTRQNEEHWKSKIASGTSRSYKIEGMRAYTIYVIKVAAKTTHIGPYSDGNTVQTAKLGLPPPPSDVKVLNVTSSTILVTWSVMSGYQITIVKIRHQTIGSKAVTSLVEVGQNQKIITNLKPSTTYELEFLSSNYNGDSSGNPFISVKTLEKADSLEGDLNQSFRFEETLLFKILVSGTGGLLLICLVLVLVTCRRCRREPPQRPRSLSHAESDTVSNNIRLSTFGFSSQDGLLRNPNYSDFFMNSGLTSRSGTLLSSHSMRSSRAPSTHSVQIFPDHLIIPWENITFEDIPLGVGNFGQVVKAVVNKDEQRIQSAVKMLKDGSTLDDKRDFLAELDTMVRIGQHKNVITLVGACEHDSVMYLCTEFAPNGNLLQYLRKSRIDDDKLEIYTNLSQHQLLQFASDVTQGMSYLSEKQLIHRDLAARNILMGENHVCKVADFGLSRGEGVYVKKSVSRLPIRWMAIESLNYNVYTTKSDVWSFGVLLWEIVSLGGTPYCGMSCAELYEKLPGGYRMEKPLNCDNEVYALMLKCWKDRPYDRPTFLQLCVALERMCDARSSRNYVNTAIFEDFCFANIDVNEEEG